MDKNDSCDKSSLFEYENESKNMLLDVVLRAYDTEWQRTHDIENKASSTVGFVGVIFSLTIVTLSSILVSVEGSTRIENIFNSFYSIVIIFVILFLMTFSIYFGIRALSVKGWWFLYADKYYESCKDSIKSRDEIILELLDEFVHGIKTNNDLNDRIALNVKVSHSLFLLSIVLVSLCILLLSCLLYKGEFYVFK